MTFAVNSDGDHQRHIWQKNDGEKIISLKLNSR